ncbi:MAG: sugar ABC transporter substrate-binding protein [Treponema sp.]|jgi:ABC-type glycerol-3-phosphate transport system substrate-binding protein|nr:sugar ABC transporter substrate-binding protein [Treponema sp.]
MKTVKTAAVLLLSVLVLGQAAAKGGGDGGSQGDPKTITWLHTGAGSQPTDWEQQVKPLLEKFYQETGIRVIQEFYMHTDMFQIIEVKIGSGSKDYDVLGVDVPMVASYATRGFLAPVDKYFTAEDKKAFIPSALEAGSWQGVFYAPSIQTSTQMLWYNKDLLKQAGVAVRNSDVNNRLTYEEITELARQALARLDPNRTNGIGGIMFEQVSRTYQMNAVPNSMGERSIGPDGLTVDGVINTPGWVKALTWYQNLYKDGLALRGFNADEISNLFRSNKVIFLIAGSWTPFGMATTNIDYGFAPVPAFKGYENKVATPTGSWHLGVSKYSTKQDAAAAFIKWYTIGEGNDLWIELSKNLPSKQALIDKVQNDPNADPVDKIATYEAARTAYPRALTPGFPEYTTIIDAMWEDVRNGSDVKGALDKAVREINSALSKYR